MFRVDYCECGMLHVTFGAFTVRLVPVACEVFCGPLGGHAAAHQANRADHAAATVLAGPGRSNGGLQTMILCHCVGVTDVTIKQLIEEGLSSVPEITRYCGAGRSCVPCREEIAALLYNHCASKHTEKTQQTTERAECGAP